MLEMNKTRGDHRVSPIVEPGWLTDSAPAQF